MRSMGRGEYETPHETNKHETHDETMMETPREQDETHATPPEQLR